MSLEKQIKDAWNYYKHRSNQCHEIAQRVKARIPKYGTPFAYPEEITKYDCYARELKEVESYIAVRQKELNRRYPDRKKENLKFNTQQVERLTNELTVNN